MEAWCAAFGSCHSSNTKFERFQSGTSVPFILFFLSFLKLPLLSDWIKQTVLPVSLLLFSKSFIKHMMTGYLSRFYLLGWWTWSFFNCGILKEFFFKRSSDTFAGEQWKVLPDFATTEAVFIMMCLHKAKLCIILLKASAKAWIIISCISTDQNNQKIDRKRECHNFFLGD